MASASCIVYCNMYIYGVYILLHTRKGYTIGVNRIHNIPLVCRLRKEPKLYILFTHMKGEHNEV
mgnify:FL=1